MNPMYFPENISWLVRHLFDQEVQHSSQSDYRIR